MCTVNARVNWECPIGKIPNAVGQIPNPLKSNSDFDIHFESIELCFLHFNFKFVRHKLQIVFGSVNLTFDGTILWIVVRLWVSKFIVKYFQIPKKWCKWWTRTWSFICWIGFRTAPGPKINLFGLNESSALIYYGCYCLTDVFCIVHLYIPILYFASRKPNVCRRANGIAWSCRQYIPLNSPTYWPKPLTRLQSRYLHHLLMHWIVFEAIHYQALTAFNIHHNPKVFCELFPVSS